MQADHKNKSTPIITPLVTKPELEGYGARTSWLIQPLEVSTMYQEYGLSQIRAMLTIIRQMQEPINNVINGADVKGQLELFKQNDFGFDNDVVEDGVVIELKMKELTNDHTQYKAIREVIGQMQKLNVSYTYRNSDGRDMRIVEPFIRKFIVPEGKQRIHSMHVVLSPQIAEMIINMDGYSWHKILENVILESTNTVTQRLYLYLSAMRTKSGKREFSVNTIELRRQAGTTHVKYNEDNVPVDDKVGYKQWGMFAKNVLDVAKDELKEKFSEKKCDFYFEWEPIYNAGRARKGEPDLVRFVTFSFDDHLIADVESVMLDYTEVQDIVVNKFGIRINNFGNFKKLITTAEQLAAFKAELDRIDKEVKGDKRNSKYFYTCCKSALDGIIPPSHVKSAPTAEIKTKPAVADKEGDTRDKCAELIDALRHEYGNGQMGYDYYFGRKTCCRVGEGHEIILCVPTYGYEKITISVNERVKVAKCVAKVFGADCNFKMEEIK